MKEKEKEIKDFSGTSKAYCKKIGIPAYYAKYD